jgi:hypothetical protein
VILSVEKGNQEVDSAKASNSEFTIKKEKKNASNGNLKEDFLAI